jgi:murein L,D-transpeptidase YcbB/YkuD
MQLIGRLVATLFKGFVVWICAASLTASIGLAFDGPQLREEISQALDSTSCGKRKHSDALQNQLVEEYKKREFDARWISDKHVSDSANVLLAELGRSKAHGLKPEFYEYNLLRTLSTKTLHVLKCFYRARFSITPTI